ncbi:MAG: hypothetical protein ACYCZR_03805 [Burkholderiales bacterium]
MSDIVKRLAEHLYGHSRETIQWAKEDKFDSCYRQAENIIELLGVERLRAENATLREALRAHGEEAAKWVSAEPVAWATFGKFDGALLRVHSTREKYLASWPYDEPVPLIRRPQA